MNALITQRGKIINVPAGIDHDRTCKHRLNKTLDQFLLKDGGLRIKVYHDEIAIEFYYKLSNRQLAIIAKYLHDNDFYVLTTPNKRTVKYRPIRSLPRE